MKSFISMIFAKKLNTKRSKLISRIVFILGLTAISVIVVFTWVGTTIKYGLWEASEKQLKENNTAPVEPSSLPLSKEYIYVGGRLVAVEESVSSAPAGSAPSDLAATASGSSTSPSSSIMVRWKPSVGGTIDHYEIERNEAAKGQTTPSRFKPLSPTPSISSCSPTEVCFPDTSVQPVTVYLYRVRAVFVGGSKSAYSNIDIATTFSFADDPLNSGGTKTPIRAAHFTELRDAVNCVRVLAGLSPFNWTCPQPAANGFIYACHLDNLQTNLSEALSRLGLQSPVTMQVEKGKTEIRADFIQIQLRNRIK